MNKTIIRISVLVCCIAMAFAINGLRSHPDYDGDAFRNTLVDQGNGDWCTPDGMLFVDGTFNPTTGVKEESHLEFPWKSVTGQAAMVDHCPTVGY